jgi:tetratricopeptide (TPR) repeat protein
MKLLVGPRAAAVVWVATFCAMFAVQSSLAATLDASESLRRGKFQQLDAEFSAVQQRFERGEITGDEARNAFRAFYPVDPDLAAKYDQWVATFPRSYVAHLARAIYYKKRGLEDRGGKYIQETSRTQIDKMDDSFGKAIKDFGDSIPMTAKPFLSYLHMLDIGRQYVPASYSRTLYEHAVTLDPSSVAVRQKYMLALSTKWGGSLDSMQKFLEECRAAKLPAVQFRQLESMVFEDEAWERENDGDLAAAELAYRKAIDLDPPDCTSCIISSLVGVLINEHKYADALPYLNEYLKDKPGNVWALSNRGLVYFQTGNSVAAFDDWSQSASAGDAFSQNRLGVLYMTGIQGHLAPDFNSGIDWLKKAAAQGNADAKRNLPLAMAQKGAQAVPR